jgi:hypothetical protein
MKRFPNESTHKTNQIKDAFCSSGWGKKTFLLVLGQ